MTIDDVQVLLRDSDSFKKAFRKVDTDRADTDPKNKIIALLAGNFKQGRTPYIHQVTFPDGSLLRLKFYDTVKKLYNSKNVELVGKESFLTYLEISVSPANQKGYFYTVDVNQRVWGTSKTKARALYESDMAALKVQAAELGLDLSSAEAWCSVYSENY